MLIYRTDKEMISETIWIILRHMESISHAGCIGYTKKDYVGRDILPRHMEKFIDEAVDELVKTKMLVSWCGRLYVKGREPLDI